MQMATSNICQVSKDDYNVHSPLQDRNCEHYLQLQYLRERWAGTFAQISLILVYGQGKVQEQQNYSACLHISICPRYPQN